ncbi:MAG: DUF4367 domain-containing protein [Vallitalea sp.]|jgi:hypothetical protein|nr:DUF4367 domain-containing protein [Vallitalea sp.]
MKDKEKVYEELDIKLKKYIDVSTKSIQIDDTAKAMIWNNLSNELNEHKINKHFKIRRCYKAVITACILIVLLVSFDLSSNASLFKRFITTVSGNTIQFYTRNSKPCQQNIDNEFDDKIEGINNKLDSGFITPILKNGYMVEDIKENGMILSFTVTTNENEKIRVTQTDSSKGQVASSIKFNDAYLNLKSINNNGVEYKILESKNLNAAFAVIGDIKLEVIGNNYDDVIDIALSFSE